MSRDSFNEVFALSDEEVLHYEVVRAWWPQFVSWPWAQRLASRYFAWKTSRITKRFRAMEAMMDRVDKAQS